MCTFTRIALKRDLKQSITKPDESLEEKEESEKNWVSFCYYITDFRKKQNQVKLQISRGLLTRNAAPTRRECSTVSINQLYPCTYITNAATQRFPRCAQGFHSFKAEVWCRVFGRNADLATNDDFRRVLVAYLESWYYESSWRHSFARTRISFVTQGATTTLENVLKIVQILLKRGTINKLKIYSFVGQ